MNCGPASAKASAKSPCSRHPVESDLGALEREFRAACVDAARYRHVLEPAALRQAIAEPMGDGAQVGRYDADLACNARPLAGGDPAVEIEFEIVGPKRQAARRPALVQSRQRLDSSGKLDLLLVPDGMAGNLAAIEPVIGFEPGADIADFERLARSLIEIGENAVFDVDRRDRIVGNRSFRATAIAAGLRRGLPGRLEAPARAALAIDEKIDPWAHQGKFGDLQFARQERTQIDAHAQFLCPRKHARFHIGGHGELDAFKRHRRMRPERQARDSGKRQCPSGLLGNDILQKAGHEAGPQEIEAASGKSHKQQAQDSAEDRRIAS